MTKNDFLSYLHEGDFKSLFIENGWNKPTNPYPTIVQVGESNFEMCEVAQQKGFRIFVGKVEKMPDSSTRRLIDTKLRKASNDYLAIYVLDGRAGSPSTPRAARGSTPTKPVELHVVSNKFGAEKEAEWDWCDVLCLPTLSDNLGLVIAEALERGKSVITTDGAPAWASYAGQRSKVKGQTKEFNHHCLTSDLGPLTYITGYREGDDKMRVQLLVDAIKYYLY